MSENKNSVRLSAMNVDIRSKLSKFDTTNEGELNMEDMMHAIVTLQKQSNNYKRLLYIILPIMVIMIASIFGTTILAINLTRDMKINSDGTLVGSNSNKVISTARAVEYTTLDQWLLSDNPDDLKRLKVIEFPNMILPVKGIFVNTNQTTIIDRIKSTVNFKIKDVYANDKVAIEILSSIQDELSNVKSKVQYEGNFSIFNLLTYFVEVEPEDAFASVKPSCSPSGICPPPKPSPKKNHHQITFNLIFFNIHIEY